MVAILAGAGLMAVGFWVVPGMVLLTREASDGTVPCQVLPVAPAPLPPAAPGARFHETALSLTFAGPDGARSRSVDCKHGPDTHAPLRIAYRPSALGIKAGGPGGTVVCSARRPVFGSQPIAAGTPANNNSTPMVLLVMVAVMIAITLRSESGTLQPPAPAGAAPSPAGAAPAPAVFRPVRTRLAEMTPTVHGPLDPAAAEALAEINADARYGAPGPSGSTGNRDRRLLRHRRRPW